MKYKKQLLIITQLDAQLQKLSLLDSTTLPTGGWVKAIRIALKMSLRQLGEKLHITSQSAREIEEREANGSLTLKGLREAANALDMKLVYGFIPKDDSLKKMIEKKAHEVARHIVMQTSHSMKLEDQENSAERIEQAIEEKAEELKREMPRYLWD
ncbi:MAG: mobile mystery protein A [Bacteroidota bacterium]|nr:mobile mystery protein A [Bacteroidota bacterium]